MTNEELALAIRTFLERQADVLAERFESNARLLAQLADALDCRTAAMRQELDDERGTRP